VTAEGSNIRVCGLPCVTTMPYLKNRILGNIVILWLAAAFLLPPGGPCLAREAGYRIGARDVLALTIYAGGEEQQSVQLTVSPQGTINVPFIGPVKAAGLTVSELREQIVAPLARDYFVNPEVNLYIKEYQSLQYYITGAVTTPGLYTTDSRQTLLTLIAKAGGVLKDRGNVAYIMRDSAEKLREGETPEELISKNKSQKADLDQLLDKGDMSQNVPLHSGDVVYIPLKRDLDVAQSSIYLEGEVNRPGIYPYQQGLTALNACLMAGGFKTYAAPSRTRIIRKAGDKKEVIRIDLNDVKAGKITDIPLKPGDLINVPESWF